VTGTGITGECFPEGTLFFVNGSNFSECSWFCYAQSFLDEKKVEWMERGGHVTSLSRSRSYGNLESPVDYLDTTGVEMMRR